MKINRLYQKGFSIIELMIATFIGLIVSYSIMEVYLAQSALYKTANSQSLIQSAENAIANLVTPIIRGSGFTGCGTYSIALSNLNPGGPPPLGNLSTAPTMIMGYSGGTGSITINSLNTANDTSLGDWSPALDASFTGLIEKGNDVVVVFGAATGTIPLSVQTIANNSNSFNLQSTQGITISAGQYASISDCLKTSVFQITNAAGTTITHNVGVGSLQNSSSTFAVNYAPGCQFTLLQQIAFFVGQGQGGQSSLMEATLVGNAWTVQPLVPGVELMKVQYGIGTNGVITQYVSANAVPNWANVYSIRMGFLLEGQLGSGNTKTTQYQVLDTQVTVPADNRIRHVYELTIKLRNALT